MPISLDWTGRDSKEYSHDWADADGNDLQLLPVGAKVQISFHHHNKKFLLLVREIKSHCNIHPNGIAVSTYMLCDVIEESG